MIMTHKAMYWAKIKENVQCQLCPHYCVIENGKIGKCNARVNKDGELYSIVYGQPVSLAVDPIEKKPLFHFYPGKEILSFGTKGCNMSCKHCQNADISQAKPKEDEIEEVKAEEIVRIAEEKGLDMIAYTYTEPTIFYEYMLDIAKLAKEKGIKNVMISNGFINKEPLIELCKYIDAANIDLKSFTEKFYNDICGASLKPVLESLKIMKEQGVWIEVTTLIIPGENDSDDEIERISKWVADNLGKETPLHFSRFFPSYEMMHKQPTPPGTLFRAKSIAKKYLDYVYLGNVVTEIDMNTNCPGCKSLLVERSGFFAENKIENGKCYSCGRKIEGRF